MEEGQSEREQNPERPINKNALTVFEHLAFGSSRTINRLNGEPILINKDNLIKLVESGEYFINEDFFAPVGLADGTLDPEQVMSERRRMPKIDGPMAMSLLDNEKALDLFFEGFQPSFELATTDFENEAIGIPPQKIEIKFEHINPEIKLSEEDRGKIGLSPGLEAIFDLDSPTNDRQSAVISVKPSAMHGKRGIDK